MRINSFGIYRSRPLRLSLFLVIAAVLLSLLPQAVAAAPAPASLDQPAAHYIYHTVKPGESLSKIAVYYGISQKSLMAANGIYNPNRIYVGQKLKIPSISTCARYHTVTYGQTLSHIAVYYGVSLYSLAQANGIAYTDYVYAGQKLCIPGGGQGTGGPSGGFWYTVKQGDTLSGIAYRYGTTVSALMHANKLSSTNRLLWGTKLWIPSKGAVSPPPKPAPKPPAKPPAKPPTKPPQAAVWTGIYYNSRDFSGAPALTRQDAAVKFDWGHGSPDDKVQSDNFSAIWTTTSYFSAGTYRFVARSDDGVRVYVDDHLFLEDWNIHPLTETISDIYLSEGNHTIRVEYFEAEGQAAVSVWWVKK